MEAMGTVMETVALTSLQGMPAVLIYQAYPCT